MAAPIDRPKSRNFGALRPLWPFVRPYLPRLVGAGFFLLVAAGTVLGLGWALRHLIDDGLAGGNAELLDRTVELASSGERVTVLPGALPRLGVLVVTPAVPVSTPAVFAAYAAGARPGGAAALLASEHLAGELRADRKSTRLNSSH